MEHPLTDLLDEMYIKRIKDDLLDRKSLGYTIIREILKSQGHWKAKPRGVPILSNLKKSTVVSREVVNTHQVYRDLDDFTEGL